MSDRGARISALTLSVGLLVTALLLVPTVWLFQARAHAQRPPAVGDLLPRIQCPPGYTARVYAQGLRSPDGLAFDPTGLLHVAEERAGQVSRIEADGSVTPILDGLDSPEGVAFDDGGSLYVVEDVPSGRLVRMDADGNPFILATGLEAPEGVAWGPGNALYVTESSLQFYSDPTDLRSRVARVSRSGEVTRIVTDTPAIDGLYVTFRSYAGIASGPDGRLYLTNELSGVEITKTVVVVPGQLTVTLTLSSTESVLALDPATGDRSSLVSDLVTPEGLRFAVGGFPLYVVEEDVGGEQGRLSIVGPDGERAALCTGFRTVEDVVVDAQGRLYVSEDQSGLIVQIAPTLTAPGTVEIRGPTTVQRGSSTTLSAVVRPLTATLPLTYTWQATGALPHEVRAGLRATTTLIWGAPGPQWITVTATNAGGTVTGTLTLTVRASAYLPVVLRS